MSTKYAAYTYASKINGGDVNTECFPILDESCTKSKLFDSLEMAENAGLKAKLERAHDGYNIIELDVSV